MQAKAAARALVQGTSLDRIEAIGRKARTGQSPPHQFSLDGMVFACSESHLFTTSGLFASGGTLMPAGKCSREVR
jgi:hypothetical protein